MGNLVSPNSGTAYTGVKSSTPPNVWERSRAPTTADARGYRIGDLWIDTVAAMAYVLSSLSAGIAVWSPVGAAAGALNTLTGDVGVAVAPVAGNIDINTTATGAISFTNGGAGLLNAAVQVDGLTIEVNGSNQLQAKNALSGTVSTVNATPTAIITQALGAVASAWNFEISLVGFCTVGAAAGQGVAYRLTGGAITNGAAATEIASESVVTLEQAGLNGCEVTLDVSVNDVVINVTGLAAHTINWLASGQYFTVS